MYDSLQQLSKDERVRFAMTQTSDVRGDLWLLHFENILAEHPELTADERSVIFEAIGLVESGVLDFDRLAADQSPTARGALVVLERRALQILPRQLMISAFGALGRPQRFSKETPGPWRLGVHAPDPTTCECNVGSAFTCSAPTGPEYCNLPLPVACAPTQGGCGFMWLFVCDGLCKPSPPPPTP